jgi:HK97 gp10 family phage protein
MAGISVNVNKGSLNKAIGAIRLFTTRKDDAIRREVGVIAEKVKTDAKGFCPVKTGNLRNSIKATVLLNGLSATVGTDIIYASYVEFGTSRQRAQPFLMPAFEANRQGFLNSLRRILSSK